MDTEEFIVGERTMEDAIMSESEDRYRKLNEMEYVPGAGEVLALGVYHGFQYAVLNIEGRHPCGYVNISGHVQDLEDSESEWKFARFNKIECHGGVSYAEPDLYPFYEGGFWIGWDYSHFGDFDSRISGHEGMKYSTDRVASECRTVIGQIESLLKERKSGREDDFSPFQESVEDVIACMRDGDWGCDRCGDLCNCPEQDRIIQGFADRLERANHFGRECHESLERIYLSANKSYKERLSEIKTEASEAVKDLLVENKRLKKELEDARLGIGSESGIERVSISRHDFDVMMDALCDAWMHRAAQCHNIEGRDIPKELHEDWSNDFERWFDLYNRLRGEVG